VAGPERAAAVPSLFDLVARAHFGHGSVRVVGLRAHAPDVPDFEPIVPDGCGGAVEAGAEGEEGEEGGGELHLWWDWTSLLGGVGLGGGWTCSGGWWEGGDSFAEGICTWFFRWVRTMEWYWHSHVGVWKWVSIGNIGAASAETLTLRKKNDLFLPVSLCSFEEDPCA
jgi:hypothetical protein